MTHGDVSAKLEERFQALEHKVSHQEYTMDELNSVVTRQQDQIDSLTEEVKKFRALVEENSEPTIDASDEPPPPHY